MLGLLILILSSLMFDSRRDADELVLEIEARWPNTDILKVFKVLRCYLTIQDIRENCALKRSVNVFRQCKQSFDNKRLQLCSSRNNKSRLKMSWTRFIRKSCSKIYILNEISSLLVLLARQAERAYLARLARSSSRASISCSSCSLVEQSEHADSRISCYA